MRLCSFTFLALTALAILPTTALAGANPQFSLPLHAKVAASAPCNGYLPVNCFSVHPVVNVLPDQDLVIYLLVANYNAVAGIQTAFEWDPSWTFTDGQWNCQVNQISAVVPEPPGGATSGTISTAFDCVTGPLLAPIGRLMIRSGAVGCLRQVQSAYPFGIHAVDCQYGRDLIHPEYPPENFRLGRVCIGQGGIDACSIEPAVEPATWGAVKATYNY